MKRVCLDSTFLISYLRGREKAENSLTLLKQDGFISYTTTINVFEIFYGYFRAFKDVEMKKNEFKLITKLFSVLNIISLNMTTAIRASSLQVKLQQEGEELGINDTFIAAIVLENGKTIITNNEEHFKRVEGLKIIDWQ